MQSVLTLTLHGGLHSKILQSTFSNTLMLLTQHVHTCLTTACVHAVHADNGADGAVQPQDLQGLVSGPHLHDHAHVHHHVAAQPHGLLLDLAGRN